MNRIESIPFANALAVVGAGAFLLCLLLAVLVPDAFLAVLGSWFHGTLPAGPAGAVGVTAGGVGLGLVSVTASAWAFGLALAAVYNRFGRADRPTTPLG